MSVGQQGILAALLLALVLVLAVVLASARQVDSERRGEGKRSPLEIDDPDLFR